MSKESELADFISVLDEYAKTTAINKFQNNSVIDGILTSSEEDRLGWTELELHNKAFALQNYSAYLQRCQNQQSIKLKWAQSNLRVLYGRETPKYERFSYQERQDAALAEDMSIQVLHKIILNAEARISQLQDLNKYLGDMARSLTEMGKAKRAERYNGN